MSKLFTYQKKDKLKSRKQTQYLFSKGQSIGMFPLKLIYTIESATESPALVASDTIDVNGQVQTGVSAPTRFFRKAVQRNRVKRLLREAYRLEKPNFMAQISIRQKRINVFIIYTDSNILSQEAIQQLLQKALLQLAKKINAVH